MLARSGHEYPCKACGIEKCYCPVGTKTACCYELLSQSDKLYPFIYRQERIPISMPEQPIIFRQFAEVVRPETAPYREEPKPMPLTETAEV